MKTSRGIYHSLGEIKSLGYDKLLARISQPAWLMDIRGHVCLSNRTFIETEISMEKEPFWSNISEVSQSAIAIQEAVSNHQDWQGELKLHTAKKTQWFEVSLELLTASNSKPLWLGVAMPISKRSLQLNAYDAIEMGERDYSSTEEYIQIEFVRRILESSQDCIKVLDLEGRLLYMNSNGRDLMEIDDFQGQVKGKVWLGFWQGCDNDSAAEAFSIASQGGIGRFDGQCATAKGTAKWWEVILTPMRNENGQIKEILSVSRDITARKQAETALKERNRELDSFVYMVSHDLKAPLRGICNLAEWIAEDLKESSSDIQNYISLMQQRTKRMEALIAGLLQYSRVGRQQVQTEKVNLNQLITEIVDSLSPPDGFEISWEKHLPIIETKKLLLTQVLSNLISNAIKHHDGNRGKIEIAVHQQKEKDAYYITVADDGAGISECDRDKIWQMFQTLRNKTSSTNTGIGLTLVNKIITEEGQKIWLEDNHPRGCKFCFTWQ